jgi:hypothetical protein
VRDDRRPFTYTGLDLPATPTRTENLRHIFLEMNLRGLVPNFHIHVSVSELYIMRTRPRSIIFENTKTRSCLQCSVHPMVRVTYAFYAESRNNMPPPLSLFLPSSHVRHKPLHSFSSQHGQILLPALPHSPVICGQNQTKSENAHIKRLRVTFC